MHYQHEQYKIALVLIKTQLNGSTIYIETMWKVARHVIIKVILFEKNSI